MHQIEKLMLDKVNNQEEIEKFFNTELTQYIGIKKAHLSINFNSIYKKIGKDRYSSPEVVEELKKRFNKYVSDRKKQIIKTRLEKENKIVKPPKPVKVKIEKPPKPKVVSVRQKVWELMKDNPSLTNKQLSEILNSDNPKTVATVASQVRWRLSCTAEYELKRKQQEERDKEIKDIVLEIPVEKRRDFRLYLISILNNW